MELCFTELFVFPCGRKRRGHQPRGGEGGGGDTVEGPRPTELVATYYEVLLKRVRVCVCGPPGMGPTHTHHTPQQYRE